MHKSIITVVLALCASPGTHATVSGLAKGQPVQGPRHCRYIAGDNGWPDVERWTALNKTVAGRLIKTRPIGSICHYPNYNKAECSALARDWGLVKTHEPLPAEFLSLYFQNNTCTPFTSPHTRCQLGNYVPYSIDVRSIDDVRAGINFAKKHNIRLVIHNSGHDFYGQSTGNGALALWMHNYNKVEMLQDYSSTYYNGPALKVQTGAEGAVAVAHAASHGYTVVSGACPTVKMAGGYLAGGGHGYLNGIYGFGADNVLEWEVVTAKGDRLIATPETNVDMYWALSGGGGGTFGVVLSATVRAFPNSVTSNAAFSFSAEQAGGPEQFWDAVNTFHEQITPLLDEGIVVEYGFTKDILAVVGIMASGKNRAELQSKLQPLITALTSRPSSQLTAESLPMKLTQADSYYDLYKTEIPPALEPLVLGPVIAGRFVPRAAVDSGSEALNLAYRAIAERGYSFSVIALNALNSVRNRTAPPIAPNAMQPNFINAYSSLMINASWSHSSPWSEVESVQDTLMNDIIPIFDAAVPGAGAYKNEANWAEKDLKQSFFGGTYHRLEEIKVKTDPEGLFYGLVSVGFDRYETDSDGRLCRRLVA